MHQQCATYTFGSSAICICFSLAYILQIFFLFLSSYLKEQIFWVVFGLLPHFKNYRARYPLLARPLGELHLYHVIFFLLFKSVLSIAY